MRRGRRWLEVLVRVSVLLGVVAWALSAREFDRIGVVLLLSAASVAPVRRLQPGRWRRALTVVGCVGLAVMVAYLTLRAWAFAPTVLAVWAGISTVPTLAWVCMHPPVRRAIARWLRPQPADASTFPTTRTTRTT